MKKFTHLAIIALLAILVISLVACNGTPSPNEPGTGGIGDLSENEVLGGENIDKNLQAYSKDTEKHIYEAYKVGYVEYAKFYNQNFVYDGDKPLSVEVPAQEQLGATTKAILSMIRDVFRDSYISEKAVNNLCDYVIQKSPEVRSNAQSVIDKLNNEGDEDETEGYAAAASNNLEVLYTKENVRYVLDLYADLVKLTGAEPIARILFEGGLLASNEIIANLKDNVASRQAELDTYLKSIGMTAKEFDEFGKAAYSDSWPLERRLMDEKRIPYKSETIRALNAGIITEEQARYFLEEYEKIEAEAKAFNEENYLKVQSFERKYPALESDYNGNNPRYYFYGRIRSWNETIDYLTSVSDFISNDQSVAALMPDAIQATMAMMQIMPSVAEMYLTANALALDIVEEITEGGDDFEAKKQDYISNFATYKGAIVKMLQSYEQLNTDSLLALSDKITAAYQNGTFKLPDDEYAETSTIINAVAPALRAAQNQKLISKMFKWCKLIVEATTAEDLEALDYPTLEYNPYPLFDFEMYVQDNSEKVTINVRKLPQRMSSEDMRNAGYNSDWARSNPDKTFVCKNALQAWMESYGKPSGAFYSTYVSCVDPATGKMYIRTLPKAMTDGEIYSMIDDLGYYSSYEWIAARPTGVFPRSLQYDAWLSKNSNLVYAEKSEEYYFDFIGIKDGSQYLIALLPHRMTQSEAEEFLSEYGDIDSEDVFYNYAETLDEASVFYFYGYGEFYTWKTNNGYLYNEQAIWYDYVEYTESSTSTLYVTVLPKRMTEEEIEDSGYSDVSWIKANATQTFVLWEQFTQWKKSNPDQFEDVFKHNYLVKSIGPDSDEYGKYIYIKIFDRPLSNEEVDYDWDGKNADFSFPQYKEYYEWKTSQGYVYYKQTDFYYVNGKEVDEEEFYLAQNRIYTKSLQVLMRFVKDNKDELKQFFNDYAQYADDTTGDIAPSYISFPPAEEFTFDQMYAEFEKINDLDVNTMTNEQFYEFTRSIENPGLKYLNYILPKFCQACGFWI